MDSALANKTHMPDPSRDIAGLLKAAELTKAELEYYQSTLEGLIAQIEAYDKRFGTEHARAFRQPPISGPKARDTKLVQRIVAEHSFRYTKDELAQMVRNEGGGSATLPEARAVGYLASGIEHMIGKGTLVRRKDGKIGLP